MEYNVTPHQFKIKMNLLQASAMTAYEKRGLTFKTEFSEFGDYQEFIITNGVRANLIIYNTKHQTLSETTITCASVSKIAKLNEQMLMNN